MSEGKRDRLLRRKTAMWTERASWDAHWREIATYEFPRASRFVYTDANKGIKRHHNIYDNTAIFAHSTLAAGMMSGMTSPARPWFRLGLRDKDLEEFPAVRQYLHDVATKMRAIFQASNTYNALSQCYEELGAFGTWANFVRSDFENVIHHYPMTVGEYAIATNDKGIVDTLYRQVYMTVGQMVKQFGRDNCSTAVKNLYDRHNLDAWVLVYHVVEPRADFDKSKRDAKNMPWASIYFEPGADGGKDELLSESGFKRFPVLAPRWSVTGNDVYGRSPAMNSLGDVKQLQLMQMRKAQAIDYMVNPPLQVPTQYKDQAHKRLPGGVMFVDATAPGGGVRSAYEVNLNLQHLELAIQDTRQRIDRAHYADLFLMMSHDERSGTTAQEIIQRQEEKMLVLGPVLERLQNELLAPLIEMTFDRMAEADILPKAPKELEGVELNVEFVSSLAQAQRAVASSGMDRVIGTVGQMVALWPEVRHKIDAMQVVDEYVDMFGATPKILVADDVAQERMQAEVQAQRAQQMAEAAPQVASAAKATSEIDTGQMRDVLNMFSGYGSPSVSEV